MPPNGQYYLWARTLVPCKDRKTGFLFELCTGAKVTLPPSSSSSAARPARTTKSQQRKPGIGGNKTIECLLLLAGQQLLEFVYVPVSFRCELVLRSPKRDRSLSHRRWIRRGRIQLSIERLPILLDLGKNRFRELLP